MSASVEMSYAEAIRDVKKKFLDEQAKRQEDQIRTRLKLIDQEKKSLLDQRAASDSEDFEANIDRKVDYLNGKRSEIAQKLRDVGKFGIKLIANIGIPYKFADR